MNHGYQLLTDLSPHKLVLQGLAGLNYFFRLVACSSPEELSHWDASLMEHGGNELSQVEPDVRYIYGRVFRSLQGLL